MPEIELVSHVSEIKICNESFLPKFSSYFKLIRVIALCFRFIDMCKHKKRVVGSFSLGELRAAENIVIKTMQSEAFGNEISQLRGGKALSKRSKLINLTPFLDQNGILRVGGRLKNAKIPYNAKNQMLLPHSHFVTKLIINSVHLTCLHGGPRLTESVLRQKFWITNSQHRIKEVINKCVKCFAMKANTMSQLMANLPLARETIYKHST